MTASYGYTRLSQQSRQSIGDQKDEIRAYSDDNGLDLVRILDDGQYQSGYSTEERHEYNRLKKLIKDGTADAVVVRGTERLGRDFDERLGFVRLCRENAVQLHDCDSWREIPIDDPYQAVMELMRAATDDQGMRRYIERAREAKKKKRERGDYDGDCPMGTRYTEDKSSLEANSDFETVLHIIDAKDDGETHREVSDEFGISTGAITKIMNRRYIYEYIDEHGSWRPADTESEIAQVRQD